MAGTYRNGAAWRDGLIIIDGSRVRPEGSEKELRRLDLLPELEKELTKTPEELRGIAASVEALNAVRDGLGFDAVKIDLGHIHVADECEFMRRWGVVRRAFTQFGHVFVQRRFLFLHFLQDLTHELVHLSTFRAVIDPALPKDAAVRIQRSGLSVLRRRSGVPENLFTGLNEGVTESIAIEVRRRVAAEPGLLKSGHGEILVNDWSYRAQVRLLNELVGMTGASPEAARRRLLTDYFGQTGCFLRALARRDRGLVGMLTKADGPADALAIAEHLGLADAAASIRRIMAYRPKR